LPEFVGSSSLFVVGFLTILILLLFIVNSFCKPVLSNSDRFKRFFASYAIILIAFQLIINADRPRHLLPLLTIVPIAFFSFAEKMSIKKQIVNFILILICFFQLFGWSIFFHRHPFNPKPVSDKMLSSGIKTFYGSYWTTYPIMFSSKGVLIGSPLLLRNKNILTDRHPENTILVKDSHSPAFVFHQSESNLLYNFESFLYTNNISSKIFRTEEAIVFYDLFPVVDILVESKLKTSFAIRSSS